MVAAAAVMHGAALLRFARQSGPYEPEMLLDWLGVRTNRSLEDCQVMHDTDDFRSSAAKSINHAP